MRIEILVRDIPPQYYLRLKYEGAEWRALLDLYKKYSLTIAQTDKGFESETLSYYKYSDPSKTLMQYAESIGNGFMIHEAAKADDIEKQALFSDTINLAIFRVVPNKDGTIYARIKKGPTLEEFKNYSRAIVKAYSAIFDTPSVVEAEVRPLKPGEKW
ncbi:MAG: hypothetical protein QXL94_05170 [Candidatus Parvarchaeum sp.]